MVVYGNKDCVNTCKQKNAGFYTWIMEIHVSFFGRVSISTNLLFEDNLRETRGIRVNTIPTQSSHKVLSYSISGIVYITD